MALFEFIALMCFIFFGVIPLFGALVGLGIYDIKRQEKAKEKRFEIVNTLLSKFDDLHDEIFDFKKIFQVYYVDELNRIRNNI